MEEKQPINKKESVEAKRKLGLMGNELAGWER
jgi:hypothetical protein